MTNSIQECTDFKDDIINDEFSGIEEIKESWKHKRTNMIVILMDLLKISNPEVNKSKKWGTTILIKIIYFGNYSCRN